MAAGLGYVWQSYRQRYLAFWAAYWGVWALVWVGEIARGLGLEAPLAVAALGFGSHVLALLARGLLALGTFAFMGWAWPGRRALQAAGALVLGVGALRLAGQRLVEAGSLPELALLPLQGYFLGALLFFGLAIAVVRSPGGPRQSSRRVFTLALVVSGLSDLWDVLLALSAGAEVLTGATVDRLSYLGAQLADMLTATGMMIAAIGTERERSERAAEALRERDAQLQRAQRLETVGQLAGGLAHDFNNLLTAIVASLSLLKERLPPGDEGHEDIEGASFAAQRAARLTRQLLTFSRRQPVEARLLDLSQSVRNLERLLGPVLGERVDRRLRLEESLWPVRADPTQVEQLVLNLVMNARDAMPGGGVLTVETANVALGAAARAPDERGVPDGEWARVSVEDTGTGMDEATQARMYEPFFTTKGPGKGSGLGLATVFGIAQQAGGFVGVRSAPGQGTRFSVYFPRQAGDLDASSVVFASAAPGRETVLLVEDEPLVRSSTARLLMSRGYRVLEASNGREALEVVAAHSAIALVVTDAVMPLLGGVELARELAVRRPGLPVLLVSGYAPGVETTGVEGASLPFLAKPFSAAQLTARVRELIDRVPRA